MKPYLFLLFIVIFILLFVLPKFFLAKDPYSQTNILFLIKNGQGFLEISRNLELSGVIKNKFYFNFYLIFTGNYKKIQAGGYLLSPSMTIPEIARKFVLGETIKIKVTIPEGFTLKQIENELSQKLWRTVLHQFQIAEFKNGFGSLKDSPDNVSLEGFLFPDTYLFDSTIDGKEIVKIFLKNFDKKLTPELREEIKHQKKTIFEIVTMASMLEKEVKTFEDKKLVSGILWKRLENGIPLQVDATITYITGKKTTQISIEDTKIDSLYNTYKYKGLPLGPICNPGLESILAAVYPEESAYRYYLSTPEGRTIFSHTLQEHNLAKAKHLK